MTAEAEQFTLGAILEDPTAIKSIDLSADDFSSGSNREIFLAMQAVESRAEVPEILTVGQELESTTGQNWLGTLALLQKNTTGSKYIERHAEQIKKTTTRRKASNIAHELIDNMESLGDMSSVDQAISSLMNLNQGPNKYEHVMKDVLRNVVDEIDLRGQGVIAGVPTGFNVLDELLGSFHDSDLIVIGARPAMGKTALLLNMMMGCGQQVGIITAEQPALQMGQRIVSTTSEVPAYKMRTGDIDSDIEYPRLTTAIARLSDRQVYFYDEPSPTIGAVQRQARKWVHKYDIKALYVDYIQRLSGTRRTDRRIDQVMEITRGLKNLARELNIPVIALAQVNREVEKRPDKRPHMGDLADSSEIEKEADVVALLYRDEVYNENTQSPGVAEFLIDKNRHGGTGRVFLGWQAPILKFEDLNHGR